MAEPASPQSPSRLDELSVNTIRLLAADMVQQANSGHPGLPLGAAPMAYVLWTRFLNFNPLDPLWENRDRFVLSAGHGSALLYSLLHLTGFDLPLEELRRFRRQGSRTPGHPESFLTPGVEVTTGPLGQGFGNGVGMAIAEAFLAARFNRPGFPVADHYTYGLVSDGDLMEGVAAEAASLAGHLRLGKLIYLYDDNGISLDGPTRLAFTEKVLDRFAAYGWHTGQVHDGNDLEAIEEAIRQAQAEKTRPSLISVKTIIGFGSPQQGTSKVHGNPLGEENLRQAKKFFGWDPDLSFFVPEEVRTHLRVPGQRGAQRQVAWQDMAGAYRREYPELGEQLRQAQQGALPPGWDSDLPTFAPGDAVPTRQASGKALEALRKRVPWIIGGSADLASSNEMPTREELSFQPGHYENSNIWFGVREHAMGAILNGMAAHRGLRVFGGTFLTFSDYMRGAIRLAALTQAPVTYVFTHDSVGLGEDGPTHQPVEQVMALRAIPNLTVIRPADAHETVAAWRLALQWQKGPIALVLTRQKVPVLDQERFAPAHHLARGGYVLSQASGPPQLLLMATGSEVHLALAAQQVLEAEGLAVRVVSLPSWELFDCQDQQYRDSVLPPALTRRLAIEAGVSLGWHRYLPAGGEVLGIDRYGESAPGEQVLEAFGFSTANVCRLARNVAGKKSGQL